jgi:hypothetical protein
MKVWFKDLYWGEKKEESGIGLYILEFWNKLKEFFKYSTNKDNLEINRTKGDSA